MVVVQWVEGGVAQAGHKWDQKEGEVDTDPPGKRNRVDTQFWKARKVWMKWMSWIKKPLTLLPTHELFRGQALLAFNPEGKLINLSFIPLNSFHLPSLSCLSKQRHFRHSKVRTGAQVSRVKNRGARICRS